ncbi:Hypothetical_protein [Hexamita inflata]|uniref:Hypothetical_protein n=1 Tax=Hexamita inflata TaxID=28002 RepID=A0AA86TZX4_9EUKA|nr:Hypothetical protein HINF_LOCUS14103 [Hexamita inflata]
MFTKPKKTEMKTQNFGKTLQKPASAKILKNEPEKIIKQEPDYLNKGKLRSKPHAHTDMKINSSQHTYDDLESKIAQSQLIIQKYQKDLSKSKTKRSRASSVSSDSGTKLTHSEPKPLQSTIVHQSSNSNMRDFAGANPNVLFSDLSDTRVDGLLVQVDKFGLQMQEQQQQMQKLMQNQELIIKQQNSFGEQISQLKKYCIQKCTSAHNSAKKQKRAHNAFQEFIYEYLQAQKEEPSEYNVLNDALVSQIHQVEADQKKFLILTNQLSKQYIELKQNILDIKENQKLMQNNNEIDSIQKQLNQTLLKVDDLKKQGANQIQDEMKEVKAEFQEFINKYNDDMSFIADKLEKM